MMNTLNTVKSKEFEDGHYSEQLSWSMALFLASASHPLFLLPSIMLMLTSLAKGGAWKIENPLFFLFNFCIFGTLASSLYYGNTPNYLWLFFIILAASGSRSQTALSPKPFTIVLFLFSVVALIELFFYDQLFVIKSDLISVINAVPLDYSLESSYGFRISGFFHNPNIFAQSIILIFIALCITKRNNVTLVECAMATFCILLSGSRAGFISIFILLILISFKNRKVGNYISLFIFGFLFSIYLDYSESFRVLDLAVLLNGKDPSSSVRVEVLLEYINTLLAQENYLILFFGNGYFSNQEVFFDTDIGNFIFGIGIFGASIFFLSIALIFVRAHATPFLLVLSPLLVGGGIYGNLRMCIFMIILCSSLSFWYGGGYGAPLILASKGD